MDILSPGVFVNKGFEIMRPVLAEYICHTLEKKGIKDWWKQYVYLKLPGSYQNNLPFQGAFEELANSLDLPGCLKTIENNWMEAFKFVMSAMQRTWAKALQETRNKIAHSTGDTFSEDDASWALDTMSRFMEPIDQQAADEIRKLLRQVRYKTENASTDAPASTGAAQPVKKIIVKTAQKTQNDNVQSYTSPWRLIAEPHPDVASGQYRQAEFAADLSQVIRGTALMEYQDPVEFFARTYITEGMKGMLSKAVMRVAGKGGDPVIQLKTAFGGGKTHSMLALYHMMRAVQPERFNGVAGILESSGVTDMPKVKVAVLVGTALDPTKARRPANLPGISINTLWGEMAAQLAEQSNDAKLYNYVKEADKKEYHLAPMLFAPC
jgi:hypothetical protein